MFVMRNASLVAASLLVLVPACVRADEAADIARVAKLPVPVVDNVLKNIDAFLASADAPYNRLVSGQFKDQTLKAVKARLGSLDDAAPGKSNETGFEERNATYRISVRTTSHNASETKECVDNKVTLTANEAVPAVKDGQFTFDNVHPHTTNWSWGITFCRAAASNGEFGEWQLDVK